MDKDYDDNCVSVKHSKDVTCYYYRLVAMLPMHDDHVLTSPSIITERRTAAGGILKHPATTRTSLTSGRMRSVLGSVLRILILAPVGAVLRRLPTIRIRRREVMIEGVDAQLCRRRI